jgi:hypothetical protein
VHDCLQIAEHEMLFTQCSRDMKSGSIKGFPFLDEITSNVSCRPEKFFGVSEKEAFAASGWPPQFCTRTTTGTKDEDDDRDEKRREDNLRCAKVHDGGHVGCAVRCCYNGL